MMRLGYLIILVGLFGIVVFTTPKLTLADTCADGTQRDDCKGAKVSEPHNPSRDLLPFIGKIERPPEIAYIAPGAEGLGYVLSKILEIIYSVALVVFIFMLVIGAFSWMMSGGNKEALSGAQKRIMHAIIGIVLLAFVALIANLLGKITNFKFFS